MASASIISVIGTTDQESTGTSSDQAACLTGRPIHPRRGVRVSDPTKAFTSDSEFPPVTVAILVCPGYIPADIIGVHTLFGTTPNAEVHLVWKDLDEVIGFPTYPTRPTTTFAECPENPDVLWTGAVAPEMFDDEETLDFLADRGSRARWVGGNCGGTLLLGAAGLLRGYRATCNFQQKDLLTHFGAVPADGNVVVDRNRITAGPLTGSIEAGLWLAREFYGEDFAREMELQSEYAPEPLFGVGRPDLAGPELTRRALDNAAAMTRPYVEVIERAAKRLAAAV
ncbi:DJ-1/PfpI family protein [Actinokineospora sp. PR83]|uniref:DJ-1/PfpI family protein n=1 Tax=Actinokineospora sp. PR83 TaxID=2884908 RepID=UPI001F39AC6D|nr:DJ-1/PfpI family protein [Actinokineospora sp. PR83]MCG8920416.1 DJ-1/PfpI family protein [Actinokineospora sp. PR83]